jgi:hypothetical protein
MKILPSRRLPTHVGSDAELSYVTDSERDAEALGRQMGGLVSIRRRVVIELPYRPPARTKTSRAAKRPARGNVWDA